MNRTCYLLLAFALACGSPSAPSSPASLPLYAFSPHSEPRWVSFENPSGQRAAAARENQGAKGHPYDRLPAGDTLALLDLAGPGIISRIWLTLNERSPRMLRSLVLNMYWDGEARPAVSVPLGDFFGQGLGKMQPFENAFFANPEGRSFNCFIPMPFRKAARVELVNGSDLDVAMLFYDIDVQALSEWHPDYLYFHACWHRDTATALAQDFELLPQVKGRGRFLGTNVGIHTRPAYGDHWWGEGEVKMYLDGDGQYPTLAGTGTEDYIGTAWGQGAFTHRYTGSLTADAKSGEWTFYRFHEPDPIYFKQEARISIQQIGGNMKSKVLPLQQQGVPLIPITVQTDTGLIPIYQPGQARDLADPSLPEGWTNYYRSDDVSATAYLYLDTPAGQFPDIQPAGLRAHGYR